MAADFRTLLRRGRNLFNDHMEAGRLSMSIQASAYHYCSPRRTGLPLDQYDSWEVALFDDDEWVNPNTDARFADLSLPRWESLTCPVGGWVKTAQVQALFDRCCELAAKER